MNIPASVLLLQLQKMLHTVSLHIKAGNTELASTELGLVREHVDKIMKAVK